MKFTNICRRAATATGAALMASFFYAHDAAAKCEGAPFNPVTEISWNGVFPIRVGGVAVAQNKNLPDGTSGTVDPFCSCTNSSETYFGTEVSFYDIGILAEVVSDAFCSPTLGTQFSSLDNGSRAGVNSKKTVAPRTFKQVHWFQFPVFRIMGMLTDMRCLTGGTGLMPGDMTEVMPDHADDFLAAIKDPKVFLFANPAADIACAAKNAIAHVPGGYFPVAYDSLFWCQWDNIYPLSGNVGSSAHLTSSAQLVARQLYTMSQLGLVLDYTVSSCEGRATGMMKSSQWRYQLAKPVKTATPFWAGQSELIWGSMKAPVYKDSNFLFVVFQKKKCCQKLRGAN